MNGIMDFLLARLLILPGIVVGLSFHEFGHAFASSKLGDPTPRAQGRVTLNPAAHTDMLGFVSLLLLGFGWGKPVQIDPRYYKHRRRDEIIVALAGVIINMILAILGTAAMWLYLKCGGDFASTAVGGVILQMLIGLVQINIVLMIFNLIPIPPLDGFGIVTQLFRLDRKPWFPRVYQMGPMILVFLIVFDVTDLVLGPLTSWCYSFLINLFF